MNSPIAVYFLKNFFLLCLSFGVVFMVLRSYRARKVAVLMPILIVSTAVLLSIVYEIELYCQMYPDLIFLATFCYFFGFVLRTLVLYFFARLAIDNKLILAIGLGLVVLNAIVYSTSLFMFSPDLSRLVLYYNVADGRLVPARGPLYYFSYFIVGIMMAYFIFISIRSLKGQRRYDALASLVCVAFIAIAVILETALVADSLLNTTIAIACLFYVVHLYQQASNRDGLTNLFDRKTFYADEMKIGPRIRGLIMVDMNSLKHINDTYGHEAGDRAIMTIAQILVKCEDPNAMYAYRLGGDEFLILSMSNKPNAVEDVAKRIKEEMAKTPYTISLGYAIQTEEPKDTNELLRIAEDMMYADKSEYYRTSGVERRKS